jgi:hypothetical protein
MQYYLATQLTKSDRDYIRDFYRSLSKLKNVLNFPDLEALHFRYKFLGDNLSMDEEAELVTNLETFLQQGKFQEFTVPIESLRLGQRSQNQANKVFMRVKNTSEFKDFVNILNQLTYETLPELAPKRKDNPELIGRVEILKVPNKVSKQQEALLEQAVRDYPKLTEIIVNNLCLIQQSFNQTKKQQKIIKQIYF